MRYTAAVICLVLTACVPSPMGRTTSISAAQGLQSAIIAEEAAFMAATRAEGLMPAFAQRAAKDAIMFLPEPARIADRLATEKWAGVVSWAPALIVSSSDGTMCLSTGPSNWVAGGQSYPGYYITIWERQPDGSLRFVFDSSADLPADLYAGRSEHMELIAAEKGSVSLEISEASLDVELARADFAEAVPYHPSARLLQDGKPPIIGPGPADSLLEQGEHRSTLARSMARSGDLAWTYGRIVKPGSSQPRAHFAQVWLKHPDEWRVILDFRKAMPKQ